MNNAVEFLIQYKKCLNILRQENAALIEIFFYMNYILTALTIMLLLYCWRGKYLNFHSSETKGFYSFFKNKRVEILIFGLSFLVFSLLILISSQDIIAHNETAAEFRTRIFVIGNFLYFLLLNLFSFFTGDIFFITVVSVFLLSFSVVSKYTISKKILLSFTDSYTDEKLENSLTINILLLLLLFSTNLPSFPFNRFYYLGHIPSNVWHNSTIIFLMPFSLLLFYYTIKFVSNNNTNNKELVIILIFCVLNIFIKPSYIFVYVICFPLFTLLRFKFTKKTLYAILVSIVCMFLLYVQTKLIFLNTDILNLNNTGSQIKIGLFKVWSTNAANIPLAVISSVLYPLIFLILYFRKVHDNILIRFSWLQFMISIIIMSLLYEDNNRIYHGNFGWQIVVCMYILFLSTLVTHITIILQQQQKLIFKDKIIFSLFFVHVISGIIQIFKSIIFIYM